MKAIRWLLGALLGLVWLLWPRRVEAPRLDDAYDRAKAREAEAEAEAVRQVEARRDEALTGTRDERLAQAQAILARRRAEREGHQ
jgi:type VI protein secretion system component VasK